MKITYLFARDEFALDEFIYTGGRFSNCVGKRVELFDRVRSRFLSSTTHARDVQAPSFISPSFKQINNIAERERESFY